MIRNAKQSLKKKARPKMIFDAIPNLSSGALNPLQYEPPETTGAATLTGVNIGFARLRVGLTVCRFEAYIQPIVGVLVFVCRFVNMSPSAAAPSSAS